MLDPLTSLSLASSIIQLVDFSSKLLSKSTELYRSTALLEYVELETIAADLNRLSVNLSSTSLQTAKPTSGDEAALKHLAVRSKNVSDELIAVLQDLKVRSPHRKWQSFRQALKSVRRKEKIQVLEKALANLQLDINSRLLNIMRLVSQIWILNPGLMSIRMQQSSIVSSLNELKEQGKRIETASIDRLERLRSEILNTVRPAGQKAQDTDKQAETGITTRLPVNGTQTSSSTTIDDCTQTSLSQLLNAFIEEEKSVALSQQVLSSLNYKELKERQSNIKRSHAHTYHWIFDKDGPYKDVNFMDWLETGSNVYWIAGKAGSGKSTLMKLLSSHYRTREALELWAGQETTALIASHFFWSGGNQLQTSQIGLLRALLYQILQQCPSLIKIACSSQWHTDGQPHGIPDCSPDYWTDEELSTAFEKLSRQKLPFVKICIFVDGLDEYRGEHRDIISVLQRVGSSPNIKVCVSSRPWNVFRNAFSMSDNRMMLQKYTKNDIRAYVSDTLNQDGQFAKLAQQDERTKDLISQIADKASGVFLWVFLVVRSLLRGLTDDNHITDLQRRVREMPEDLEDYFALMLNTVEPFYREQTAHIFLISVQATQPQSIVAYSFLERVASDPDFALGNIKPITDEQIVAMHHERRSYLNARCKDLLEITESHYEFSLLRYKVDFLHRTVRDFLSTRNVYDEFKNRAASTFDARKTLCRMHLAQIKAFVPAYIRTIQKDALLKKLVDEFLYDTYDIEIFHGISETVLLNDLNRFLSQPIKNRQDNILLNKEWMPWLPKGKRILEVALKARLYKFVTNWLDEQSRPDFTLCGKPLLYYTLEKSWWAKNWLPTSESDFDLEMIRLLLEHGASPNDKLDQPKGTTVWDIFVDRCAQNLVSRKTFTSREKNHEYEKEQLQVAEMFIEHGADVDSKCFVMRHGRGKSRTRHSASEVLEACLEPTDWARIEAVILERRKSAAWKWLSWLGYN